MSKSQVVFSFYFFSLRRASSRDTKQTTRKNALVLGRGLLQGHGHLERRVVRAAQVRQQLPSDALHHHRARVVALVDPVPEAEQPPGVVPVLRASQGRRDVLDAANVEQHAQASLVGPAVGRPPERRDSRGDAGEGVGLRRPRGAHGAGGGVLLFWGSFCVIFLSFVFFV